MPMRPALLAAISAQQFSPSGLFSAGEVGAWYDPSDFSTMFQDSAGTTPVTAVEQPVGLILDKSKSLALSSEQAPTSDFSSATGWTFDAGASVSGGSLIFSSVASTFGAHAANTASAGSWQLNAWYKVTIKCDALTAGQFRIRISNGSVVLFPASTGIQTIYVQTGTSAGALDLIATGVTSGTIDYISVVLISGNHASQATSTSRPVLSARVNLLTYSEQFDNAAWQVYGSRTITPNATTAPDGTLTADLLTAPASLGVFQPYSGVSGVTYTWSVYLKAESTSSVMISFTSTAVPDTALTIGTGGVNVGNGWYRYSGTQTLTAGSPDIKVRNNSGGSAGFYVWGIDVRATTENSSLPPYQQIAASTSYSTAGFPYYLAFDGTDDSLSTASIDFSATDKMTVWAGVRKLSDAATGVVAETGTGSAAGSIAIFAPANSGANSFRFASGGTIISNAGTGIFAAAPNTSVLTGIGDIVGDVCTLRRNGSLVETIVTDQGLGNNGNYPLNIGIRSGGTLPLNGRLYSLIVRGKASTSDEISRTETWVNGKTGAY